MQRLRCQNFSQTRKSCQWAVTQGTVTQKNQLENVISPLSSVNFLKTRSFLKHWRVLQKKFSGLGDNKFDGISWFTPSRLPNFCFLLQKFSGIQKGHLRMLFVSVLWGKTFSTKPNAPRPMHQRCRKEIWNTEKFRNDFLRYCQTKIVRRKNVISPSINQTIFH